VLERSVDTTALALGDDGAAYLGLMTPLVANGEAHRRRRAVAPVLPPVRAVRRSPGSD
jgi:hypothetical protein